MRLRTGLTQRDYVYLLVDPRDDKPFYVGKGRSYRMYEHAKLARRGYPERKHQRIREIWQAGKEVEYRIIGLFTQHRAAHDFEFHTMKEIGFENLTNHNPYGARGPYAKRQN